MHQESNGGAIPHLPRKPKWDILTLGHRSEIRRIRDTDWDLLDNPDFFLKLNELLRRFRKLESLPLSVRAQNILESNNLAYYDDLLKLKPEHWLRLKRCGVVSMQEIQNVVMQEWRQRLPNLATAIILRQRGRQ